MSERRQIGDRVRLRTAPAQGVLVIANTPQNVDPWSCTGSCSDDECVEWVDLLDEKGEPTGVHANECDLVADATEREPGFYWVVIDNDNGLWSVCEWGNELHGWVWTATGEEVGFATGPSVLKIGPRIEPPNAP